MNKYLEKYYYAFLGSIFLSTAVFGSDPHSSMTDLIAPPTSNTLMTSALHNTSPTVRDDYAVTILPGSPDDDPDQKKKEQKDSKEPSQRSVTPLIVPLNASAPLHREPSELTRCGNSTRIIQSQAQTPPEDTRLLIENQNTRIEELETNLRRVTYGFIGLTCLFVIKTIGDFLYAYS